MSRPRFSLRSDRADTFIFWSDWQRGPEYVLQIRQHLGYGRGVAVWSGRVVGYSNAYLSSRKLVFGPNLLEQLRATVTPEEFARFSMATLAVSATRRTRSVPRQTPPQTLAAHELGAKLLAARAWELFPSWEADIRAAAQIKKGGCSGCAKPSPQMAALRRLCRLVAALPQGDRNRLLERIGAQAIQLFVVDEQRRVRRELIQSAWPSDV